MKLDYKLTYLINNHKVKGITRYDNVGNTIWFSRQDLCNKIGKFLNMQIPLETEVSVSKEQLEAVRNLLKEQKNLIGIYGNDFLND